jgi:hypothetical protein
VWFAWHPSRKEPLLRRAERFAPVRLTLVDWPADARAATESPPAASPAAADGWVAAHGKARANWIVLTARCPWRQRRRRWSRCRQAAREWLSDSSAVAAPPAIRQQADARATLRPSSLRPIWPLHRIGRLSREQAACGAIGPYVKSVTSAVGGGSYETRQKLARRGSVEEASASEGSASEGSASEASASEVRPLSSVLCPLSSDSTSGLRFPALPSPASVC